MSFGFSAGDFVASIVLISNVVRALDASTGSVSEVEALLSTLKSLKQVIRTSAVIYLQCVLDDLDDGHSLVAKNIKSLIDDEHKHCDEILDSFIKSLKPYNEAFIRTGGSSLTRQARKITWLFRKTDAAQVNMNLTRHLTALEMYCTMLSNLQSAAIQKTSSTTLSNVLGIRADVTTILSVIRPQSCMPASLGYSWETTPALSDNVLLLDAIGRSVRLPIMLLGSVEDLHGLLVIMYRNIPGKKKIARREYNLTDEESDGALVEGSNWETTVHPGMTLSLNMIFPAAQTIDLHRCPQCDMPCLGNALPGQRRRCQKCQLTFRIFDKERAFETFSSASSGNLSSPQVNTRECGLPSSTSQSRGVKSSRDDDFFFKNIHFHRYVPGQPLTNSPSTVTEDQVKQLIIDELPPLHKAAATGNCLEIVRFLEEGHEIDSLLPFNAVLGSPTCLQWDPLQFGGCTPLHLACWFAKLPAIMELLDRGSKILAQVLEYKYEALTFAIQGHDPERVFYPLVERGARLDYQDIHGDNPFNAACATGKTFLVHYFLRHGARLEFAAKNGLTPLQTAACAGHERAFGILLDHGADIAPIRTSPSDENWQLSTLNCAAIGGSLKILKFLLDRGQDPYSAGPYGDTVLHWAAYHGLDEIIELLLQHGADCNHKDSFLRTSLYFACSVFPGALKSSNSQKSAMQLLLEQGALVDERSSYGETPLHISAANNEYEIAELLLENHADVNACQNDGCAPLHVAAWKGHLRMVKLLLQHGADVNKCFESGPTVLIWASMEGNGSLVELLLNHKANVDAADLDAATSLHYSASGGHLVTVQLLLDHGSDVDIVSKLGRTAFHSAARWGRTSCMTLLLAHDVEINTTAPSDCKTEYPQCECWIEVTGCTPLMCSSEHGHLDAVKFLLENGADITASRVDGKNSLSCAVESGNVEIAELLLEHGVDFEFPDLAGLRPLAQASRSGKDGIMKLLLKRGALTEARDLEGRTALYWACLGGFDSTARILVEHGAKVSEDSSGRTLLDNIEYHGSELFVQMLLDNGTDLRLKLKDGTTLGYWAKSRQTVDAEAEKESKRSP